MPSPDQPDGPMLVAEPAAPTAPGIRPVRYRVRHLTRYHYGDRVSVSHHVLHLVPRPHPHQVCEDCRIHIDPLPSSRADWTDFFGNPASYCEISEPHDNLVVESQLLVTVSPMPAIDLDATPSWEQVRAATLVAADDAARAVVPFVFDSMLVKATPDLAGYAAASFTPHRAIGTAVMDLTSRIYQDFCFDPAATTVSTPLAEVLGHRRGVCQDFAHLGIGCLRALGLPARYVSGYLRTLPPPGRPRLTGADASHAWLSAWCGPDLGWIDFDPTNDQTANMNYITVAWGRDYDDVSPVRGVILGGAWHDLTVEVDVEPLEATPRNDAPPRSADTPAV